MEPSPPETLRQARARHVARALASHPILPAGGDLSHRDGRLQQLLADLARGGKSEHVSVLREVSEEQGVPLDEIARRAQFTLACFLLPASGTFYEVLDVAPDASAAAIRAHWTAAIHRYHPDRFGGQNPWLDAQARRLIEAYETLRDPERRRRYDADLARRQLGASAPLTPCVEGSRRARRRHLAWRLAILLLGVAGAGTLVWLRLAPAVGSLPPAPVPPAPRLLDAWRSRFLERLPAESTPRGQRRGDAPRAAASPGAASASGTPPPAHESSGQRPAPSAFAGRADSDRERRAEPLATREPARDAADEVRPTAESTEPAAPAAAPGTAGTSL